MDLGHTPYLLARQGAVYGQPMHETSGVWDVPNRVDYPSYSINPGDVRAWATYHKLDAVVFNEEHQHELAMVLRQAGIKTIHYIDYLGNDWRPMLRFYDQLWTATDRTLGILESWKKGAQTVKIGWGVEPHMFGQPPPHARFDFFSNQGWIGLGIRKGLDSIVDAMDSLRDDPPEVCIHCQLPVDAALQVIGRESLPPHVIWEDATVPPPGLYHVGRVVVQPSKLEGLGLSLVEAMAAGRPIITTDAPPMHAWVTPECGWLVPVERVVDRGDGIVFPEAHISPDALAKTMQEARQASDALIDEKARLTLERAHDLFHWERFTTRIQLGLERMGIA